MNITVTPQVAPYMRAKNYDNSKSSYKTQINNTGLAFSEKQVNFSGKQSIPGFFKSIMLATTMFLSTFGLVGSHSAKAQNNVVNGIETGLQRNAKSIIKRTTNLNDFMFIDKNGKMRLNIPVDSVVAADGRVFVPEQKSVIAKISEFKGKTNVFGYCSLIDKISKKRLTNKHWNDVVYMQFAGDISKFAKENKKAMKNLSSENLGSLVSTNENIHFSYDFDEILNFARIYHKGDVYIPRKDAKTSGLRPDLKMQPDNYYDHTLDMVQPDVYDKLVKK